MKLALLFAGCLALHCADARAAVPYGVGARSCGDFVSAAQIVAPGKFKIREMAGVEYNSANNAYHEWALGFVTGLRYGDGAKESKKMSGADFDQALRTYCMAHPAEPFANAVEDLARREGIARK
jgi:hypothetical protein